MNIDIDTSEAAQKAMSFFKEGYNCSQSVVLAFEENFDFDRKTLFKLSSSFGGGMGRLREVCGGVTAMFIIAGVLYGYDEPTDIEGKKIHYARIQELAHEFSSRNGSIVCRDLLGLSTKTELSTSYQRTEEYYTKRPCVQLVGLSAAIIEEYIRLHS